MTRQPVNATLGDSSQKGSMHAIVFPWRGRLQLHSSRSLAERIVGRMTRPSQQQVVIDMLQSKLSGRRGGGTASDSPAACQAHRMSAAKNCRKLDRIHNPDADT